MRRLGYGFVSDKGYVAFAPDLSQGAWAAISIQDYDAPDQISPLPLEDAPQTVIWKLRATWCLRTLIALLGGAKVAAELDPPWDAAQKRLYYHLSAAENEQDPKVQQAAKRLKKALTRGGGLSQTTWGFREEVIFGKHQVELTREGQLAEDAQTVNLGPILKEIHDTTLALAAAIGFDPEDTKGPTGRVARLRKAHRACCSTFATIHHDIAWAIAHTPAGEKRVRLENLLSPFVALLDQFPPPSGPGTQDTIDEEDTGEGEDPPGEGNPPGGPAEGGE